MKDLSQYTPVISRKTNMKIGQVRYSNNLISSKKIYSRRNMKIVKDVKFHEIKKDNKRDLEFSTLGKDDGVWSVNQDINQIDTAIKTSSELVLEKTVNQSDPKKVIEKKEYISNTQGVRYEIIHSKRYIYIFILYKLIYINNY